jgi:putative transcriptional regulator
MAGVLNVMRFFFSGLTVAGCLLGLVAPGTLRAQEAAPLEGPRAFILVAAPELGDRNFARSVVLVTPAPGGEMIGVILNRPTGAPWPGGLRPLAPEQRMNFGGPLVPRAVFSVAQVASSVSDTMDLGEGLRLAIGLRNTRNLAQAGAPEGQLKLFNGYAGWGPGQLRAEIAAGAWQVRPVSAEVVFDPEPATQWERLTALRRAVRAPLLPESQDMAVSF